MFVKKKYILYNLVVLRGKGVSVSKKLKISIISLVVFVLVVLGAVVAGILINDLYQREPMATVKIESGVYDADHSLVRNFEDYNAVFGRKDLGNGEDKGKTYTIRENALEESQYVKIKYTVTNDSQELLTIKFDLVSEEGDNFFLSYSRDNDISNGGHEIEYKNAFSDDVEAGETIVIYFYVDVIDTSIEGDYNATLNLTLTNNVREV